MILKACFYIILMFGGAILGAVTCGNHEKMTWCFSHLSYYLLLILFIFWIAQLFRFWKERPLSWKIVLRENRFGILLALLLTAMAALSVPDYFRVLSDETNLLAVSKSMTYERNVDNVTMGKWYYFNFYPFNREVEKRPFLFPFFVHLAHIVRGYHPENVFLVNGIILFLIYFFLFAISRTGLGSWGGAASFVLFSASQPVLAQSAASGGFDLLFVLFAILSFSALWMFLDNSSSNSFLWLWANLLMIAHTRHESLIFPAVIFSLLLVMGKIKTSYLNHLLVAASPLFLLPRIWQHILRIGMKDPFETPEKVAAFSWHHVLHHNWIFLKSLADFRFLLPYATLVNLAGTAAVLFYLIRFAKKDWPEEKKNRSLVILTAAGLAVLWLTLTGFHMGDPTHPTSARYFILFFILFSFLCTKFLCEFPAMNRMILCLFAFASLLLYHPLSIENRFANRLFLPREYRLVMDYFKKLGHQNFLVIADRPGQFTVQNYGSVNFEYANSHKEELLSELGRHLYRSIYVIQEINYDTKAPGKEMMLDPEFALKPVWELQNKAESFIRISEVES